MFPKVRNNLKSSGSSLHKCSISYSALKFSFTPRILTTTGTPFLLAAHHRPSYFTIGLRLYFGVPLIFFRLTISPRISPSAYGNTSASPLFLSPDHPPVLHKRDIETLPQHVSLSQPPFSRSPIPNLRRAPQLIPYYSCSTKRKEKRTSQTLDSSLQADARRGKRVAERKEGSKYHSQQGIWRLQREIYHIQDVLGLRSTPVLHYTPTQLLTRPRSLDTRSGAVGNVATSDGLRGL